MNYQASPSRFLAFIRLPSPHACFSQPSPARQAYASHLGGSISHSRLFQGCPTGALPLLAWARADITRTAKQALFLQAFLSGSTCAPHRGRPGGTPGQRGLAPLWSDYYRIAAGLKIFRIAAVRLTALSGWPEAGLLGRMGRGQQCLWLRRVPGRSSKATGSGLLVGLLPKGAAARIAVLKRP